MNHRAHAPRRAYGALPSILLACLLAACGGGSVGNNVLSGPVDGPPPQAGSTIVNRFTLTNQDGQRVSDGAFAGKYRLVYMGFANCPDVCPVDLQVMGQALRRFEALDPARGAKLQPIFITVDPERDTPDKLKAYVANFHPRLVGLTGSPQEVAAVVDAHGGSSIKGDVRPDGSYNVDHSRYILLFGPQGELAAIVPHENADALVAELDKWVR